MKATVSLVVEPRRAGHRVDQVLAATGEWGSRANVQRLIGVGGVRIDGVAVKPGTIVKAGQVIEIEPQEIVASTTVEAEAIPLSILHEDQWLIVIDKPAGLVVHPAAGHWRGTLVSALLHHWGGPREGLDGLRPGLVHRLDKDTSGVLVVAKDATTLDQLAAQFRDRQVEKEYQAVVVGKMPTATGVIDKPIGRHPVDRKKMAIRPAGREAVTRYEVLAVGAGGSFLKLMPRTGRTHQIRVHLASIGHPIVGDAVYGGVRGGQLTLARQALHAAAITFEHPGIHETVRFAAPLPADIAALRELIQGQPGRPD